VGQHGQYRRLVIAPAAAPARPRPGAAAAAAVVVAVGRMNPPFAPQFQPLLHRAMA
jgi:hypothetical protein